MGMGGEVDLKGMIGSFANFHSTMMKQTRNANPKTRKHSTMADFHGCMTPPNSSPRRAKTTPATMKIVPFQC
jgi:hypothetical protein